MAGTFSFTGSLNTARDSQTATVLNNGKVLIVGGVSSNGDWISGLAANAEIYDPVAGTFSSTGSLNTASDCHTATLLNNGQVLIVGGNDVNGNALASAELYDPTAGAFTSTGSLTTAREAPTATLLINGTVLFAGGMDNNYNALASAELYQPATLTPGGLVSIAVNPQNPPMVAGFAQHFVATGTFTDGSTQTLASATWSSSDSSVAILTNDATNSGNAFAPAQGSFTVGACTGSICGSTAMTAVPLSSVQPQITNLSPSSGGSGSWVAISGINFGATQPGGAASFGGISAQILSWSDTAVMAIAPNGISVRQSVPVVVTTLYGTSNAISFTVAAFGTGYRVWPQSLNMLVGESRTVSVTDASGNPVTGLAWTTSNSNIVSLSTDDPPLITALAPGTAIVFAGGLPIPVTVYAGSSLPQGTPIWSVPFANTPAAIPAVPGASGADLFVLDGSTLRALASDGSPVWQAQISRDNATQLIPDFSGGDFVTEPYSYVDGVGSHSTHILARVDPSTQQLTTLYTFADEFVAGSFNQYSDIGATQVVIPHPSGVVFVLDFPATNYGGYRGCPHVYACSPTVSVIDPSTGQTLGATFLDDSGSPGGYFPPAAGQMIVAVTATPTCPTLTLLRRKAARKASWPSCASHPMGPARRSRSAIGRVGR